MENNRFNNLEGMSNGKKCPRCGVTYAEFKQTSLLGCPVCYRFFRDQLIPYIRRVQFTLQHEGKFPASTSEVSRTRRRINLLRQELSEAVMTEDFERAAKLRDEVIELTKLVDREAHYDR